MPHARVLPSLVKPPLMNNEQSAALEKQDLRAIVTTSLGLGLAVIAVVVIGVLSVAGQQARTESALAVKHTFRMLADLDKVLLQLRMAESGQRGYLLTNDPAYLETYNTTSHDAMQALLLAKDSKLDPDLVKQLESVEPLARARLALLKEAIDLAQKGDREAALKLVTQNSGFKLQEQLDQLTSAIRTQANDRLASRQADWESAANTSVVIVWGGSALLVAILLAAGVFINRESRARAHETWIATGQRILVQELQQVTTMKSLGQRALSTLAQTLNAQIGALYVDQDPGFRRIAAHSMRESEDLLKAGEGLVGQAARSTDLTIVREVPPGYFVESGTGKAPPRELVLIPATADGVVQGVIELGFFTPPDAPRLELLRRASTSIGIAVRTARDRARVQGLLEETQAQSEELQAQQEELRVSNEELEEQARALKEQQGRLENQATELETTNEQLSEHFQRLTAQKDALRQSELELEEKADALEQANQHKSEFLANMSHELRTPLNSSLILAKLLGDNRTGNLTAEQVKYANTIESAGNDLLLLINDVLDLSKIEAGKIQITADAVPVARMVTSLERMFRPIAAEKGLALAFEVATDAPATITTDSQRALQILTNLLSNALKFTDKGQVTLKVRAVDGQIAFDVSDTGIGIAAHQQESVFEAFRQADGSTHRKYGGTGLGLSIARDLARALGGDVRLSSTAGHGSTFTLLLPLIFKAPAAEVEAPRRPTSERPMHPLPPPVAEAVVNAPAIKDDRAKLTPTTRHVLVIEDDLTFARILSDLAHEQDFLCVIAPTADDGLRLANETRPHAILLDIMLPDHSGLMVLDRLKASPTTRHIPVHIISCNDQRSQALAMGAVGYAIKPVDREKLTQAFEQLKQRLTQKPRHVLLVEDDQVQQESVKLLLGTDDVEVSVAATGAEALAKLKATTFDCVVMDLGLEDVSGFDLLETMASEQGFSFPPVIVYTGRSMSADEEQRLRRYSKSIIIKGAHSPERLLDEVMLFLHHVESTLPADRQRMLKTVRDRDRAFEDRKILVVEDDVRNIFALSAVLEPRGAKLEIARNGLEALDAIARMPPGSANGVDLVLMDIMMPEMDGLTAMREIRKRPDCRALPIIALTAKAMKDDLDSCRAAGASDYIAKPLDVDKLVSLVRVWLPT